MLRSTLFVAAALTALALPSCTESKAEAPKELRFTVIPDFNKAKLVENCATLSQLLQKKLGVPVTYVPSNDYTMAVNALIANKVDFAWLGGKTTVDALDAGKGEAMVLATRDIDLDFKTYFIANKKLVDEGKLKKVDKLADLKGLAKDFTFTFGDKNSTSGHLMPRFFLTEAGIDPNKSWKGECGYQASGGHGATLKAVASGATDIGALNFSYWEKASAEDKAAAPVIFVTPGYVDYAWVGHARVGKETLAKITEAFTKLDKNNADDKAILDAWSAKEKFQVADGKLWDSIRKVRDSLPPGFLQ
ncbi:MAG: phosphate/phosphite/phosphonate ABC transporter substrate-binding protein [Planctomycetes bacterium]|nr:phosphate/phosphite/phosphonate ABC transporter substrate-binding protein [Planctomycetota bacterium]